MIIISDIHGCYYTLRRLLRICPDEEIIFAGDLVDRGPHSRQVVEFAMKEKIPTVMGNHDHMMVDFFDQGCFYDPMCWFNNGGHSAFKSWHDKVPLEVIAWMRALPLSIDRGHMVVSHTGHHTAEDLETALWARDPRFCEDGKFRIFGHTAAKDVRIERGKTPYACIDTGAAYGHQGLGILSAFQWPSMRVFQMRYDESPMS